jgi:hypothetical protein
MDYSIVTIAFLDETRDFVIFHSLLVNGIIGGIVFLGILDKA